MSDYFTLYKTILSTIQKATPETGQQLFDALSHDDYITHEKSSNPNLVQETLAVLDNLIADGLVNAKQTSTKKYSVIFDIRFVYFWTEIS